MKADFTTEKKEQLEYLLSLEKASRIAGKAYEDMARNYNHSLNEKGEAAEKFVKYTKLHSEIITELEKFLNKNV